MCILSDFLSSLLLTALMSFIAPVMAIGTILAGSYAVSCIPGCTPVGHMGIDCIVGFLAIFGNGLPRDGIITIGLTSAFAGALLDLFSFCVHRSWYSN